MKKHLAIIILLLISVVSIAQNNSNAKRIKEIRKKYIEFNKNKKNFETIRINSEYFEGTQFVDSIYLKNKIVNLIKVTIATKFSVDRKEYYFENGKVFFIYIRYYQEGHWLESPKPFHVQEYRYYFDKNEQLIKILEKKIDGQYTQGVKLQESVDKAPIKELKKNIHLEYKKELKNAQNIYQIYNKLIDINILKRHN